MSPDADQPSPHPAVPDDLAEDLTDLTDRQLRHTAGFIQELLNYHWRSVSAGIEAEPGEEIAQVVEHDAYTEVVKREPCAGDCEDCPHGPYLYHVTREHSLDGEEHLHCRYIGRVAE
jgi:hypothetical protein